MIGFISFITVMTVLLVLIVRHTVSVVLLFLNMLLGTASQ